MKKFLIIGSANAITYKEVFPLIKNNQMWLGTSKRGMYFVNDGKTVHINSVWFTNLDNKNRHKPLELTERYSPDKYPKYDNYDAIEVSKTKDIPMDYNGVMGVPVTFMDRYCPQQFEIVGCPDRMFVPDGWKGITREFVELYNQSTKPSNVGKLKEGYTYAYYITNDGKPIIPYTRILIRRKMKN